MSNRKAMIFDEEKLITKKMSVINAFNENKKRFLKIKLGKYNFYLNKKFKIHIIKEKKEQYA